MINSASLYNIFRDKKLLTNIKKTNCKMTLHSNSKKLESDSIDLCNGMHIWYNPNALVNILSLLLVSKSQRVMMDTAVEKSIKVEWREGE